MSQIRFCYPCKIQTGANVPAGTNSKGVPNSARRRVNGVIKPVCDTHALSLEVIRAEVAGVSDKTAEIGRRTTSARQSAETALIERAADAERDAEDLARAERAAAQYLTPAILRAFSRAAGRRAFVDTERSAARDEMVDRFVEYVAARVIRFEPPNVDKIVGAVCALNTSERSARRVVRLDATVSDAPDAPTLGALIEDVPAERVAWRVAGRTISRAEMVALATAHGATDVLERLGAA